MSRREPAWRVLTRELELAIDEERGTGDRAASYLRSPFGGRFNRVLLAGSLSRAEALGRDEPPTFWRARLTDPLGSVAVTAGAFQPRAMGQLRSAPVDRPALVVGKVHLYQGRDGSATVSVRAEAVRPVSEGDERATIAEALRHTLDRLDLLDRLEHEPAVTDAGLRAAGYPALWIRAAREAIRRFPEADRAGFRSALSAAVRRVAGTGVVPPAPERLLGVTVTVDPIAPAPRPPTEAERADEAVFLDLVDAATVLSPDGYADVQDVLRRFADRGLDPGRAEAVLGRLEEGGRLHEPVVGKLRRA